MLMKTEKYLSPEMEVLDVQVEGAVFESSPTNVDGVGFENWGYEEF